MIGDDVVLVCECLYNSCNLGEINLKCKYSDPTASLVAVHSKIRVVTNEARTCIINCCVICRRTTDVGVSYGI